MAATPGFKGFLKNGANSVALVTDWDAAFGAEMYDTTAINQGNAFKNFIAGLLDGTLKVSVIWDFTDTNGQLAIWNAYLAGTVLTMTASPNGTNSFSISVLVKQVNPKVAVNKANTASLDLQVTGSYSYA